MDPDVSTDFSPDRTSPHRRYGSGLNQNTWNTQLSYITMITMNQLYFKVEIYIKRKYTLFKEILLLTFL